MIDIKVWARLFPRVLEFGFEFEYPKSGKGHVLFGSKPIKYVWLKN